MQYSEIAAIPSLELRGIVEALVRSRARAFKPKDKESAIDCDTVDADDYRKWFKK